MKHSFLKHVAVSLVAAFPLLAHAAPAGMSDAQVAKALVTINEGEADAADLALKNAQSPAVQNFAGRMKVEHERNIKDTEALAKREKINGSDKSDLSKSIENDAKDANKALKKTDKLAFDQAYMSEQVKMHEKALSLLKDSLIPATHNPQLKSHLEATSKAVAMHLDMAKALQK